MSTEENNVVYLYKKPKKKVAVSPPKASKSNESKDFPFEPSTIQGRGQPEQSWSKPYILRKLPSSDLKPRPHQIDEFVGYLKSYTLYSSVLVDENNFLLGGHDVDQDCKRLGAIAIPVYRIKGLTTSEKYACARAYRKVNKQWRKKK